MPASIENFPRSFGEVLEGISTNLRESVSMYFETSDVLGMPALIVPLYWLNEYSEFRVNFTTVGTAEATDKTIPTAFFLLGSYHGDALVQYDPALLFRKQYPAGVDMSMPNSTAYTTEQNHPNNTPVLMRKRSEYTTYEWGRLPSVSDARNWLSIQSIAAGTYEPLAIIHTIQPKGVTVRGYLEVR